MTTRPEDDLRDRMVPSEDQRRIAAAIMAADATVRVVIVPIAMPGKQVGFWQTGQAVFYPNGFWPVRSDPDHRAARDAADETAGRYLRGLEHVGVSAYCVIRSNGTFAVYEGIFDGSEEE